MIPRKFEIATSKNASQVLTMESLEDWTHRMIKELASATEMRDLTSHMITELPPDSAFSHQSLDATVDRMARLTSGWLVLLMGRKSLRQIANWMESLSVIGRPLGLEYVTTGAWTMNSLVSDGKLPNGNVMPVLVYRGSAKPTWNGGAYPAHWSYPLLSSGIAPGHYDRRPMQLNHALIRQFSNEGEMIFDPYAGRGGFGAAAHVGNRFWYGRASNPEEFDMAQARLTDVANDTINFLEPYTDGTHGAHQ